MKKLILIFTLCSTSLFSQLAPPRQSTKIDLHLTKSNNYNQKEPVVGPLIMLGGGVMALAGYLTIPPYQANSTQPKPFFQQGGRMVAIMTGATTFLVGATFTIAGK